MVGRKALVQRNTPVALIAKMRFHSSRVVRASGAEEATPALLTRMSTPPSSAIDPAAQVLDLVGVGDVAAEGPRVPAVGAQLGRPARRCSPRTGR